MIEFACHTWAFNNLTLTEAMGTIARLGFRYIDIGSGANLNAARAAANPKAVAAEITGDLDTFYLKVSDLYLMLPRISLDDDEKRDSDLNLYQSLLPFAQALGTPGITLSPGLVHPAEDEEAWDRTVAALRQMVKQAGAVGLELSIEPHLDSMAPTPELALKLVNDVRGLKITLDWAHMICQGIALPEIEPLLPYVRHTHVRQATLDKLQTVFDEGKLDLNEIFTALNTASYEGVICIEYMKTPGWHGMVEVDSIEESIRLRDALRRVRDALVERT